jgi:hypothetical protein
MHRLFLDLFELFILYVLYLARIRLLSLIPPLSLPLAVRYLLVKLVVDCLGHNRAHIYFHETVGCSIRQVVHATVVIPAHTPTLRHVISVILVCYRMLYLQDLALQG